MCTYYDSSNFDYYAISSVLTIFFFSNRFSKDPKVTYTLFLRNCCLLFVFAGIICFIPQSVFFSLFLLVHRCKELFLLLVQFLVFQHVFHKS